MPPPQAAPSHRGRQAQLQPQRPLQQRRRRTLKPTSPAPCRVCGRAYMDSLARRSRARKPPDGRGKRRAVGVAWVCAWLTHWSFAAWRLQVCVATVDTMLVCVVVVSRGRGVTPAQRHDRWFGPHGPHKSYAHTGLIYEARAAVDARQLGIATQRLELFGPFQSVGGVHRVGPGELSVKTWSS